MKFTLIMLFAIVLLFSSCHENEEPVVLSLSNKTLTGTFQRIVGTEGGEIADVTIRFENNTFEGSSNITRYPAICNGTYTMIDNKINFTNSCFFTADFDWTLILNGEFVLSEHDDKFLMTKELGVGPEKITDIYTFKRDGNHAL